MSAKVVIVGGGTMGLAAAWALARAGHAVELFERFGHVHEQGSHGGHTRIIRHAYHEGSDYVDLVTRADRAWTALGERCAETLLVRCGLLEFGPAEHPDFCAAMAALREHDIPHEALSGAEAQGRFPFEMPEDWRACLSPDSGYLRVAACLDALRGEAEAAGARLHYGARVRELVLGGRPRVLLEDGSVVAGDRLVVAAGARTAELLPGLAGPKLSIYRRVLAWFQPGRAGAQNLAGAEMPTWAAFVPEGFFYGFPDHGVGSPGFKIACHSSTDPDFAWLYDPLERDAVGGPLVDRDIHERDLRPLREFLGRYFPAALGALETATTCLYTNTRSEDFWIDRHPDDERVIIASGFSGHGFKFAPAIGELLAELAIQGQSDLWLPRFATASHA